MGGHMDGCIIGWIGVKLGLRDCLEQSKKGSLLLTLIYFNFGLMCHFLQSKVRSKVKVNGIFK
jgi:hypothetical protein